MDDLANEFPAFNAAWKPFNQVYLTNGCVLNSHQMFTKAPINNLGHFNGQKIAGAGVDFDLAPPLRVSFNANKLLFHKTDTLEALRVQGPVRNDIGWDFSSAVIYRPGFIQNVVLRLSGAMLRPGDGFHDLFDNSEERGLYYSVLFNAVLTLSLIHI